MNKESFKNLIKKEWKLPYSEKATEVIKSFSLTEKTLFFFFVFIFIVSGLSLLFQVNKLFLVKVPDYGGKLEEGIVGSARFINPLLAASDIDKDLTSLVYSGLLKVDGSGHLIPDLAENYSISDDGLTYTFKLKDNIYFHDGVRVTADDIVFTVEKAQDPALKSPREINWAGVKVTKIDDRTITFTLKQPYSPFIQNATIGILPKHIWRSASIEEFPFSQYNTKPIGTGPYKVNSISLTSSGLPSQYELLSFNKYSLGRPFITTLVVKSYQNEKDLMDAYKGGDIESFYGISPKQLAQLNIDGGTLMKSPLPRIFGLFFNQNVAPVFVNKEVRQALDVSLDKKAIINTVLAGYGEAINSPVPLTSTTVVATTTLSQEERLANAKKILEAKGWKKNGSGIYEKKDGKNSTTLTFSISTGNAPELKETAYIMQKNWQDLGALVEVKIFEIGDLNQNIIKTRKYDSLLFGEIVGRDLDLYPFWHSSERANPGLNIALYTNLKADKILENLRETNDESEQKALFLNFNKEIQNDVPAVFTYSPYFIYIVPNKVQNVSLGTINVPAERFIDVGKWYIETNNVWNIFREIK